MSTLLGTTAIRSVSEQCRQLPKAFKGWGANGKLVNSPALLTEACPQHEDKVKTHEDCKLEALPFSLHAIGGSSDPQTMLVKARIGNRVVVVLIDSGSTHNFVCEELAHSLGLDITPIAEFNVNVANGESLVSRESYERVSITLQGFRFSTTLYSLPLRGPDLVLGIQWLRSLGTVACNWRKKTMEFKRGRVKYVIKSSSVKSIRKKAVRRLERDVQGGGELFAITQKGGDNDNEKDLDADLKDEFLLMLSATVKCLTLSEEYFEKDLRLAINKQGTDEGALDHAIA